MRHNEVRDITATLLTEVCHGVTTEPHLQPLSGESFSHRSAITDDGARLDVAMYGFIGVEDLKRHLLMSGFLTPAPNQIVVVPFHLYIANMSRRREGNTISVCVRWSMQLSHHWCCLQLVEWDVLLQHFTSGLHQWWLKRGMSHML